MTEAHRKHRKHRPHRRHRRHGRIAPETLVQEVASGLGEESEGVLSSSPVAFVESVADAFYMRLAAILAEKGISLSSDEINAAVKRKADENFPSTRSETT